MILRQHNINNEEEYLNSIQVRNNELLHHLVHNNFVLPEQTPVEIHPYISEFNLGQYDKYIIGTFPPISYLRDNQLLLDNGMHHLMQPNGKMFDAPKIPFYHGNRNSMWDILLENDEAEDIFNHPDRIESKQGLKNFLNNNSINYSDIIYSTRREKYTSEDSALGNIVINEDLFKHILSNIKVDRLLFNTSNVFGISGLSIHRNMNVNPMGSINVKSGGAFDFFFRGLQDRGVKVEFCLLNDINQVIFDWYEVNATNAVTLNLMFKTKIIIKTRISIPANNPLLQNTIAIQKEYFIITPFSPAAVNRGKLKKNHIINNWLHNNVGQTPTRLLKNIYKAFVNFDVNDQKFLLSLNH
ncbi:hypothetical protein [Formosa maritima]|uniref:Uncharacterized protein n=1 Tax=Formosa maritima TaxID=2592046 RepID=A0A5D0GD09_9FLAO|nr:hypothetical protein [Formosa maritima]TYA55717.1 hypothetical protein FVF61_07315 [Formosa maritima]